MVIFPSLKLFKLLYLFKDIGTLVFPSAAREIPRARRAVAPVGPSVFHTRFLTSRQFSTEDEHNLEEGKSSLSKPLDYFKFCLGKSVDYLNSPPVNWWDPWVWCCLAVSCLVLTYLTLEALMLLIGQFILIFILIESASTRFELFNYKWNVHVLRLMVSIPIYMSIYGTILLIQQMIFIVITDLDLVEIFIVLFNSILMAPIVYSIFKTSYRFLLHRTIPRRGELLVCTFALYWTTLGKMIYEVIGRGPRPSSIISYMLPTDPPKKSSGGSWWTFHEKLRKGFEDRIEKSQAGEHTGEASAPSDIQSRNLEAAADRA